MAHLSQRRTKMTYEEFLNSLDEDTWAEWVDGEVVPMVPVSDTHQDLAGWLAALMRVFPEVLDSGVVRQKPFQMKAGRICPGGRRMSSSCRGRTCTAWRPHICKARRT